MTTTTQNTGKTARPPYRIVCHVGQPDRKFWEQNGVGFAHKKTEGAIVFTPPFDIKAGTPCMMVANTAGEQTSDDIQNDDSIPF